MVVYALREGGGLALGVLGVFAGIEALRYFLLSASYLARWAGSPKTSWAAWISWNLTTTSASRPGLRSGWSCGSGQ